MSQMFSLDDLKYDLPLELIAQHPLDQRDASRMLVLDRTGGTLRDSHVMELPELLRPPDVLVLNDTKVVPARFTAHRETGGTVDGLFLWEHEAGRWEVMLTTSRRLHPGEPLRAEDAASARSAPAHREPASHRSLPGQEANVETGVAGHGESAASVTLTLEHHLSEGRWIASVSPPDGVERILERIGRTPLPPYIRRPPERVADEEAHDRVRYQTIYARRAGAVAAPTAGLHLTERLLRQIGQRGINVAHVTLHIGPGTFQPIRMRDVSRHRMHREWYDVPEATSRAIEDCRALGGRVVALGTTSVRVLETAADLTNGRRTIRAQSGWTELFIFPPYSFRLVDAMMTNFHLPGSTLLAMVMAFAGVDTVRSAYRHAIEQRYRFYSFGDAMLIL